MSNEKNNDDNYGVDSISAFDEDDTGETETARPVSTGTKRIINPDFVAKSKRVGNKRHRRYGATNVSVQPKTDNNVYPPTRKYEPPRNAYKPSTSEKNHAILRSSVAAVLEPLCVLLIAATAGMAFVDGVPLYALLLVNIASVAVYFFAFVRRGKKSNLSVSILSIAAVLIALVVLAAFTDKILPHLREIVRLREQGRVSQEYLDGIKKECIFSAIVSLIVLAVLFVIALIYERDTGCPISAALLALIGGYILFLMILDFTVAQNMPKDASSVYSPSFFLWTVLGSILYTIPGAVYAAAVFFITDKRFNKSK